LIIAWWTFTTIDKAWISNVRFVVWRTDLAVPARRKEDFSTNAMGTVVLKISLVRKEVTIKRRLRGSSIVHAVEANGFLA
jgi:hypothetical protein